MDVVMPQLGETVAEGTVTKWYKKVGDSVKADETLFDVETDKVSTEVPAPVAGVIAEILVAEGVAAKVGTRLAVIREAGVQRAQPSADRGLRDDDSSADSSVSATRAPPGVASPEGPLLRPSTHGRQPSVAKAEGVGLISPVVSRLLAEHNLNARDIRGTGRDGRITREDVLAHIARSAQPSAVSRQPLAASPAGGSEIEPLNNIRKRTGEHMAKSWTTVPHVLQAVEADFERVDEARGAAGAAWKGREGYSLTYLPFVARAVAQALTLYPRLNASFHGDHLVLHRRINLGIAVDLNREGLMVPVVKDAAGMKLPQLARAIHDLATRARAGKLRPDDMTEATYTLSNNGAYDTLFTAPIISPPQVAILSTDGVRKRAVVIKGERGDTIAVRPVGMLAQTFDHRAVDGSYSASFLGEVRNIIETRDWLQELQ
jgi:pyruvate dehydrogenase E2 component (dihydrolipoamide acetyltransferase)